MADTPKLSYRDEVLADAPLGYWRLNEAEGPAINLGSLGAAFNGTVALDTGRAVDGLTMDGDKAFNTSSNSSGVKLPSSSQLSLDSITYEILARPNAISGIRSLIMQDSGSGIRHHQWRLNGNKVELIGFNAGSPTTLTSVAPLSANQTYHLAAVLDGVNLRIYINGKLDSSRAALRPQSSGHVSQVSIGDLTSAGPGSFIGILDEAAIYAGALSPERILAHYDAISNPTSPDVVSPAAPAWGALPI